MPAIVELRQNRNLIRSNFDGYKLSLEAVPVLRQDLPVTPYKAEPNEDQYALLHAELFSLQNLLQVDPWARSTSYHVNRRGEVVQSTYDDTIGKPEALTVVYRVSGAKRHVKGDYNYSMRFISEKYCVLCDGVQQLLLLNTGDRLKKAEWKPEATVATIAKEQRGFMLYDSRLDIVQERKRISLAMGRVQRVDAPLESGSGSSHYLHLHWAKWECANKTWTFSICDTLEGKGSLYYCAFEPRDSLIISSNRTLQFRSLATAVQRDEPVSEEPPVSHNPNDVVAVDVYSWSQTDDNVTIRVALSPSLATRQKDDYEVDCTATHLKVQCEGETLLDVALHSQVDPNLTNWKLERNSMEIMLTKQTAALIWTSLLADDTGPAQTTGQNNDNGGESHAPAEPQPIANLEAPIEDCDFPMATAEDEIKIERFHLPSQSITHRVLMGSTPPLFASNLRSGYPSAIVTRQDVDATVWLQQYSASKPNDWSLRHEGNLDAFGYIQASKQQKKFMDCSPDLNYAIICESHRHVFLYKSRYDTANVRNRNGPQVTIGKQHLITLPEDAGEVLGLCTAPNVVTLLTEKCILYLQIC